MEKLLETAISETRKALNEKLRAHEDYDYRLEIMRDSADLIESLARAYNFVKGC